MRWAALLVVLFSPAVVCAQPPTTAAPATVLSSIAVDEGPTVVINASGPLPAPRIGVLRDPDRIYIDFAGVSSRSLRVSGSGDVITVRAAQHSLDPLVARVVIDLRQPARHTIRADARLNGRLEISLAPRPSPSAAPARLSPAPVRPAPARKSTEPRQGYAARIEAAIQAAGTLRGVLHDLDSRAAVPAERLREAETELGRLRQTIDSQRPPRGASDTHDLLLTACRFGATALELASTTVGEVPLNASSAAAGALLMMDRAQSELAGRGGHPEW